MRKLGGAVGHGPTFVKMFIESFKEGVNSIIKRVNSTKIGNERVIETMMIVKNKRIGSITEKRKYKPAGFQEQELLKNYLLYFQDLSPEMKKQKLIGKFKVFISFGKDFILINSTSIA